jgi:hypothetical protein
MYRKLFGSPLLLKFTQIPPPEYHWSNSLAPI